MGPGANRGGAVTLPAELDGVVSAYRAAVLAADADALMGLYPDVERVFDAGDRWEYLGLGQWRACVEEWFAGLDPDRFEATSEEVRGDSSGPIAWLAASVRYAALAPSGEVVRSMHNRLTWVLRRTPDGWRVAHEHTSAPVSGPDGRAILSRPAAP